MVGGGRGGGISGLLVGNGGQGDLGNNMGSGGRVGFAEGERGGGSTAGGKAGNSLRDVSGLNPNRTKGFGVQQPWGAMGARMETPTLNQMKAKQGAIVAKFMTFFRRKSTLVIEMYEKSFYKQKPTWDKIADFIYSDLCQTPELRKEVKDVQFHPVKMLLFIRFSEDNFRDEILAKVQSAAGLVWSDYRVKVKGYSLDAEVKFVRLLGVSPETGEEEIRRSFVEAGIGEVIDIKKGLVDVNRLPGVTNGTWELRVKIHDPEKVIPSYIHRRDEGELWSLNFEGRVFCCWKCGSGSHIGDKCREQTRTFDEIFSEPDDASEVFVKPTWAAVVRSGNGDSDEHKKRVQAMEQKLKEENQKRDRARSELEEKKKLDDHDKEKKRVEAEQRRVCVVKEVAAKAAVIAEAASKVDTAVQGGNFSTFDDCSDQELLQLVEPVEVDLVLGCDQVIHPKSLDVALQHRAWLASRQRPENLFPINITVDAELENIFGAGATRLALEYEGWDGGHVGTKDQEHAFDLTSTPLGQRTRRRKRGNGVGGTISDSSHGLADIEEIDDAECKGEERAFVSSIISSGSEGDTSDEGKVTKKPRLNYKKGAEEISSDSEVTRKEDSESSGDSENLPLKKTLEEEGGME